MMAGNPSWWSMHQQLPSPLLTHNPSPSLFPPPPYVVGSPTLQPPHTYNSLPADDHSQDQQLPHSWSQLLLGGLSGEEERFVGSSSPASDNFRTKNLENWETQILNPSPARVPVVVDVKQEVTTTTTTAPAPTPTTNLLILYGHGHGHGDEEEFQASRPWSSQHHHQMMAAGVSSPRSCITSLSTNMLDFSYNKSADGSANSHQHQPQQLHDHSNSECNSTAATGGASKKARVQPTSSQPPLKVRKEKLGDRITALHQLVSPFGKTDTASVLLEAIGYIRFLQGQIEALSSPYLGAASPNIRKQQSSGQGERNSAAFPEEDQGQDNHDKPKDLRSRGLCLVPVSCTQQVGSDNGADYWAPAFGSAGF